MVLLKKGVCNNMPRVVHFEIPADNPNKAAKFYEDVFGWKIEKWEGPFDYWMVTTGEDDEPGINGAIYPREEDSVGVVISVDSFDEFAQKIESEGGKMVTDKMIIPGEGITGSFQDTEGNVLSIMEPEPMDK